ncbi:MAG: hypothetical protein UIT84_00345, partial [Lachnospiraceae bacterium]
GIIVFMKEAENLDAAGLYFGWKNICRRKEQHCKQGIFNQSQAIHGEPSVWRFYRRLRRKVMR